MGKQKKPIFKKWWFWVIVVLVIGIIGAAAGGSDTADGPATHSSVIQETPDPVESETSKPSETQEPAENIKSGKYTLPSGFNINFSSSVRNDVTGNWRLSTTSDSFVPAEYAVEYYKTMFSSDNEIHAIWNATLGTTTRITVVFGVISADTFEYVDGEEHDAKVLFSGTLLDSKMFDAETGEEISE